MHMVMAKCIHSKAISNIFQLYRGRQFCFSGVDGIRRENHVDVIDKL